MSDDLLTVAEQSDFRQTGRLEEVDLLCKALVRRWPGNLRLFEYGRSAENRPMQAIIASGAGSLMPDSLRSRRVPVLMIQAGIHPGESDGKDGGFVALRDMLDATAASNVLNHIALLFVPAFNVDGHERVGRWGRPNQNGPEETGWRTTSQNLNLNRDYTKSDTPEMSAMLGLINDWDPLVCADLHVTDGADFQPDVSIQVEPTNQGDSHLWASGCTLRDELISHLTDQGSMPLPFYPDLAKTDDPASGFLLTVFSPRFSTGYFPLRNRFTVLVETHSWKPYGTRVHTMRNTILGLAALVGKHGDQWMNEADEADARSRGAGGSEVTLNYTAGWREPAKAGSLASEPHGCKTRMIDFPGYAYTREVSPVSGDRVTVYDPKTPQTWRVPFRGHPEPSLVVRSPVGGYVVPAPYADLVGRRFTLHGIVSQRIEESRQNVPAQVFRATNVEFSPAPVEGRTRATLDGAWRDELCQINTGALYAPIEQRRSRLLMALLEPKAPDSLLAWGFFNACFEQKEQIEPYVADQIARAMLKGDKRLQTEFARRLQDDPAFASSPSARLEFFLRRHASWDDRYNLYPIIRVGNINAVR